MINNVDFIHVYFCEATYSMYFVSPSISVVLFVTQLRSADKQTVNKMKVYIERNNLQLEL